MKGSDIIATFAVIIAVIIPIIQITYERIREWHNARESLLRHLSSLYEEISRLVENPHESNGISFQVYLKQRIILLDHFHQRFILKRTKIEKSRKVIIDKLIGLPEKYEYEKIIIKGKGNKDYAYLDLLNDVRIFTVLASEALIK